VHDTGIICNDMIVLVLMI